ncbi:MAG TPA: hypothetical protein ENI07_06200 [Desulfobacterales bacterium]|nr:hypothetical protein [Desulfobacterales bacterium]
MTQHSKGDWKVIHGTSVVTKELRMDETIERIMRAGVFFEIGMLDHPEFTDVRFEVAVTGNDVEYTWMAHTTEKFVFPIQSSRRVKYWKTLNGAKRNFIRKLKTKGI